MNKKVLILALSIVMLTGCGNKTDDTKTAESNKASIESTEKVKDDNKSNTKKEENKSKVLSKDDEWIVDGQWKLKILDVKTTDDRNEFSEKEPKQVVVVSYTYENIGYEDDVMDGLFLTPEQIIDETGSVGYIYPGETTHNPDEIPVGSKIEIAEEVFGLDNESKEVSINFVQYDGNGQKQKATFKVPVN